MADTGAFPPPLMKPSVGFLGLSGEDAVAFESARAVVVPFGLEASVSYGAGTSRGPAAILEASHQVELFDEGLWREPFRDWGVVTLAAPSLGDIRIPAALDRLAGVIEGVLAQGKFPLTLGGEHSVTAGAIRPFAARFEDLVVVQIDAHADLRDGYDGEHYSHAAAMRRVLDHDNISLVSFGIRNISAEEIPFLEAAGERIDIHWAKDREHWDYDALAAALSGRNIYLTIDLDGFDSSVMPATGTPEPGGIFWPDAIRILETAARAGTIVGADICELAPIRGLHAPDFLAAKLAYRILTNALSDV